MQASLGECDTPRLAAEVSRAGGLGTYTLKQFDISSVRRHVKAIRARTTRPVLIALNQPWEQDDVLDVCAWHDLRWFQVFWWNGPRLVKRILARNGQVFWQVNTVRQAQEAVDCGAHVLVLQGNEAGGQIRGPLPLFDLMDAVQTAVGEDVPLVAGGGLATKEDVSMVLRRGAKAALLGTRFLLSDEARADDRNRARLLRATVENLFIDTLIIDQWPCAPRRRLITHDGIETPDLYAGMGIGKIHRVLPAREIVQRLSPRL